jgi:hypothetical protein
VLKLKDGRGKMAKATNMVYFVGFMGYVTTYDILRQSYDDLDVSENGSATEVAGLIGRMNEHDIFFTGIRVSKP